MEKRVFHLFFSFLFLFVDICSRPSFSQTQFSGNGHDNDWTTETAIIRKNERKKLLFRNRHSCFGHVKWSFTLPKDTKYQLVWLSNIGSMTMWCDEMMTTMTAWQFDYFFLFGCRNCLLHQFRCVSVCVCVLCVVNVSVSVRGDDGFLKMFCHQRAYNALRPGTHTRYKEHYSKLHGSVLGHHKQFTAFH